MELLRLRLDDPAPAARPALRNEPGGVPCEEMEEAEVLRRRDGSLVPHDEGEVGGGVDCENAGGGEELWRRDATDLAVRRELFERTDCVSAVGLRVRYELDRDRLGVWLPLGDGSGESVGCRGIEDGVVPKRCR
jgi:hypothetical protein